MTTRTLSISFAKNPKKEENQPWHFNISKPSQKFREWRWGRAFFLENSPDAGREEEVLGALYTEFHIFFCTTILVQPLGAADCHNRCGLTALASAAPRSSCCSAAAGHPKPADPTQPSGHKRKPGRVRAFPLLEQYWPSGGWEPVDKYFPLPCLKWRSLRNIPQFPEGLSTSCTLQKAAL